jgi:uncharacterized protein YmfQ (DUF2313 family)
VSQDRQTEILANYLPEGRAFGGKRVADSVSRLLLEGIAQEMLRSTDLVTEFRDEILPDETTLFIEEWESAVGIPDDCFLTTSGTIAERRRNILAKLVSLGVQTAADFVALAALFGITATVKGGSVHGVFPYEFPIIFFPDARTAFHTIVVDLAEPPLNVFPYTFPITFQSQELALVECLFRKVKPAHVDILFIDLP